MIILLISASDDQESTYQHYQREQAEARDLPAPNEQVGQLECPAHRYCGTAQRATT